MSLMKSATATVPTDLACEVAALRSRLTTAEATRINPAELEITNLRAELDRKQSALDAVEESQANTARRQQAEATLRAAERAIEFAKDELNQLRAKYLALPGLIRAAEFRFDQALKAASVAKQNLEVH